MNRDINHNKYVIGRKDQVKEHTQTHQIEYQGDFQA